VTRLGRADPPLETAPGVGVATAGIPSPFRRRLLQPLVSGSGGSWVPA